MVDIYITVKNEGTTVAYVIMDESHELNVGGKKRQRRIREI